MGIALDSFLGRRNTDFPKHLDGTLEGFLLGYVFVMQPDRLYHLGGNLEKRIEAGHGVLENHGDFVAPDRSHLRFGNLEDIHSLKEDFSSDDFSRG